MVARILRKNNPVIWLMFIVLSACDTNAVYHSYNHIPIDGWNKSDTLFFTPTLTDSLKAFQLSIDIRNKDNYPYTNIYLFISHNETDSCVFVTDTLECVLANKEGKWIGTGWGTLYQSSFAYMESFTYKNKNVRFKISHGMKDALLQGVSDIGIHIREK